MSFKPWLLFPAKVAHDLSPIGLKILGVFGSSRIPIWKPMRWKTLELKNRLGIAGGVDKDASSVKDWWKFGPGFIEIGTVTPVGQEPNPGKIIDRSNENRALWNKMGFPGSGAEVVKANLAKMPTTRPTPIFVNIGKNRTTPNEEAANDYVACIRIMGALADAYVVNISSPNTTGLRDLFKPEALRDLLGQTLTARDKFAPTKPMLLKLSPDLDVADLQTVLDIACEVGIDGFIATNTTLARGANTPFPPEGGVSGAPLTEKSRDVLHKMIAILGARRQGRLIISAGGVMTPQEVQARLDMGADLVQVYTALVFEGPGFFKKVAKYVARRANESSQAH